MQSNHRPAQILSLLIPFFFTLGLAWYFKWSTKDLIWSLWLSSLTVGLLIIVWGTLCSIVANIKPGLKSFRESFNGMGAGGRVVLTLMALIGSTIALAFTLFVTAFVVFHFSAFHGIHGIFLNHLFPLFDVETTPFPPNFFEVKTIYWPVFSEYIAFIPVAIWSQWKAFRPSEGFNPIGPYLNVIKMHLLIFFFAAVAALGLENFWVYAFVYALYFFPWEVFRKKKVKK